MNKGTASSRKNTIQKEGIVAKMPANIVLMDMIKKQILLNKKVTFNRKLYPKGK
tara:strand:- start:1873 stop:2034 length:162 start_codon:yes stop_codon:yes gene_type:complete